MKRGFDIYAHRGMTGDYRLLEFSAQAPRMYARYALRGTRANADNVLVYDFAGTSYEESMK